jgi:hypothetical protein
MDSKRRWLITSYILVGAARAHGAERLRAFHTSVEVRANRALREVELLANLAIREAVCCEVRDLHPTQCCAAAAGRCSAVPAEPRFSGGCAECPEFDQHDHIVAADDAVVDPAAVKPRLSCVTH